MYTGAISSYCCWCARIYRVVYTVFIYLVEFSHEQSTFSCMENVEDIMYFGIMYNEMYPLTVFELMIQLYGFFCWKI